ncbi:hypothetical protein K9L97_03810 [Candidatus Woesearchaeota archaeon]|nr:hypothetical protein [Candidatus Woesearchaeota archaeon]
MIKQKKAQTSVEFVILIGFGMLLLIILLNMFLQNMANVTKQKEESRSQEIFNLIKTEIDLAYSTRANYTRTFKIPTQISGSDIQVRCIDNQDILITINERTHYFLLQNITEGCTQNLKPGSVTIKKEHIPDENDLTLDYRIIFIEN